MTPTPAGTAVHVIEWDAMTPEQQADHLVYAHGYNPDYFGGSRPIAGGAGSLRAWHASAHERPQVDTVTVPHDHDKDPAVSTERLPLRGAVRVIPWDDMTPGQQREHLRHFHDLQREPNTARWLHMVEHLRPSSWKALPHTHDKGTR